VQRNLLLLLWSFSRASWLVSTEGRNPEGGDPFYGRSAFGGSAPRGLSAEEDQDDLFSSLLAEWLHFTGPVPRSYVRTTLGCDPGRLDIALADLLDNGDLISGNLIRHSDEEYICDSGNFEMLLRLNRLDSRPAFEALDIRRLPLFAAAFQGIAEASTGLKALEQRMEQLVCYTAQRKYGIRPITRPPKAI